MQTTDWNVLRVAAYGAGFGVLFALFQAFLNHTSPPIEFLAGTAAGGAVSGALVFAVIALARNFIGHSRHH